MMAVDKYDQLGGRYGSGHPKPAGVGTTALWRSQVARPASYSAGGADRGADDGQPRGLFAYPNEDRQRAEGRLPLACPEGRQLSGLADPALGAHPPSRAAGG